MLSFTYFLVLFFTIIICFIYSFHRKIRFNRFFLPFLKSAIIVGIPFILWDVAFTKMGVWWFNETYTVGIKIFNLPLEECLFFLCIPFSCTFTYFCLTRFFDLRWINGLSTIIVFLTVIVCMVITLLYNDRMYTMVTGLLTTLTVVYLFFIARVNWISQASFIYTVLMLGFFPVNGVLTGTGLESPIVNYNPNEHLNFRLGTIPIEDSVYGYSQFLWIIYFFKWTMSPNQKLDMEIEGKSYKKLNQLR